MDSPNRLYRSDTDRIIAGVAGGIARYLQVDSTFVRLAFVFLALFHGSGVLLYVVCWLIMPPAPTGHEPAEKAGTAGKAEPKTIQEPAPERRVIADWSDPSSRSRVGTILIIVGLVLLLVNVNIIAVDYIAKLWPVLLLIIGWLMLTRTRK